MKKLVCALTASLFLSGCAGIINGTSDNITITSVEPGTRIYVDGVKRGIDDALVQIDRGETHTIKVVKKGCEPVIIETGDKFDATSLLGILLDWGVISIPVDLISGAAWKAYPTIYTVSPICEAEESQVKIAE
ncbi:hypothetical protein RGQ13_03700 [Thalassotalea psychrophila]|uniref:PEGA domain-containing protein n=1 Tax=Thalassotalea psychrophila TaxID=3065647 RepID=A0ABY9TX64_9GAMM|nr:hypothetical protein RGQ13_03700 [Colwelliaceae bacterium SQ149]